MRCWRKRLFHICHTCVAFPHFCATIDGDVSIVTLEEGEDVETVLQLEDEQQETIELIVPEAHVECEVSNFS